MKEVFNRGGITIVAFDDRIEISQKNRLGVEKILVEYNRNGWFRIENTIGKSFTIFSSGSKEETDYNDPDICNINKDIFSTLISSGKVTREDVRVAISLYRLSEAIQPDNT